MPVAFAVHVPRELASTNADANTPVVLHGTLRSAESRGSPRFALELETGRVATLLASEHAAAQVCVTVVA